MCKNKNNRYLLEKIGKMSLQKVPIYKFILCNMDAHVMNLYVPAKAARQGPDIFKMLHYYYIAIRKGEQLNLLHYIRNFRGSLRSPLP